MGGSREMTSARAATSAAKSCFPGANWLWAIMAQAIIAQVHGMLRATFPFQMGEAPAGIEPRTPDLPKPRTPSRAPLPCVLYPLSIPQWVLGAARGIWAHNGPVHWVQPPLHHHHHSQAFVVTGVCESPECRMPMTPSGRGTTRCF